MGRFNTPISATDRSLHHQKPEIPKIETYTSLHYFGRRSNRVKYGITPESFMEMDMTGLLIQDKVASFLYPAEDDNLHAIERDSILVIDRSIKPQVGHIVVVDVNGETLLRRFVKEYDPNRRMTLPALITDGGHEPIIFLHHDYCDVFFKGVARSSTTFLL